MKSQNTLLVGICLLSFGCNSGTTATRSVSAKPYKSPAYLRFANQTNESIEVSIDGAKVVSGILPSGMSEGCITSLRDHKISGMAGSKEFSVSASPISGQFVTVVIKGDAGKLTTEIVKGESAIVPEDGSKIEFINLSDASVSFKSGSESKDVPPNRSALISVSSGGQTVEVKGFGKVDFNTAEKEIWGVCVMKNGGKLTATPARLKGPRQPMQSGASAAG